jgi:ribosome maturation factor RimP
MKNLDRMRPVIEDKLAQMGFELYDIRFSYAGPRSLLRVFIDKDGGVTIGDCEAASNELSAVLDVEEFLTTPYRLDVSSPGIDRPLKTEKDFRRAAGRTILAEISAENGKRQTVRGKVLGCADGTVRLECGKEHCEIPVTDIAKAKIEISFK